MNRIQKNLSYLFTEKKALSFVLLIFFTIFTTISLHRYWQYSIWYYDFGIFYQAISSVARFEAPIIDHFVVPGANILGDHFHPFIFTIVPFYALFPKGETLLVMQTLFVTISGIFIYLTAKALLKKKIEVFCILIIYLSFIGLHNALISEFHEIALLPLPLSIFFYGMVKKSTAFYMIGFLGVLLTKETTFIIPAWFGILIAIQNKGLWRKIGMTTTLFSVLYGYVVISIFIPMINGDSYHYTGAGLFEFSTDIVSIQKLQTIGKTLLSFGFLPILAPETLPPVLFNWWSRFVSGSGTRYDLGLHYNAEIAPTLAFASMYGWIRLKHVIKSLNNKIKPRLVIILITAFSFVFGFYVLKSPALMFFNRDFYRHTQNMAFLNDLLSEVPEDGVVMAQHNLAGKLAYRKVYILRDNYKEFEPDYIVIDTRSGQEPNNFFGVTDFEEIVTSLSSDDDYEIYYDQGEQKIYKKR